MNIRCIFEQDKTKPQNDLRGNVKPLKITT